jgi:diguanylate cyclase (GGDEF)-like protein
MIKDDQSKKMILIIDDTAVMRSMMSEALQQAGYDVAVAENGKSALALFEKVRPDAVMLDVMMPDMDGFDTCRALRKLPGGKQTPILMVTGLEDVESIHNAFEAGATDFISKPINWVMFGYRVRYTLRSNQAFLDLHLSQARLDEAQQLAKLGNWELNPETQIFTGSPEFYRISGLHESASEISLSQLMAGVHPDDHEPFNRALAQITNNDCSYSLDYRALPKNSQERLIHLRCEAFFDSSGNKKRLRGIIQDVTELRKAEEKIRFLAYYDGLTGLANRTLFRDRLQKALAYGYRQESKIALLFLDLDRFKRINDTLGHQAGDLLLKTIANRIDYCVRETDSVSRLDSDDTNTCVSRQGGDEFVVLLTGLTHPMDAGVVAQRIIDAITKPVDLQEQELYVTASIGISLFPSDGANADTLLKNADTAMYEAKKMGGTIFNSTRRR